MTKLHETRMTDLEGAKVLLEEDIHELKMINHELFSQVRQSQMELDDFDEHNQIRNIEKRWSHNEQNNQSLLDIIKEKVHDFESVLAGDQTTEAVTGCWWNFIEIFRWVALAVRKLDQVEPLKGKDVNTDGLKARARQRLNDYNAILNEKYSKLIWFFGLIKCLVFYRIHGIYITYNICDIWYVLTMVLYRFNDRSVVINYSWA